MKGTVMRFLPNIAHLKRDIAKNIHVLHVNESSLIRLIFLQETQIYAQNRHGSCENLIAKSSSVVKLLACPSK
jgi:hypothetical protein